MRRGHDTRGDRAAHPFGNLAALRSPFGQKWAHGFASPPHDGFALSRMRAVLFVWGFMASKGKGGQWRVAWDLSSVKLKTTFTRRPEVRRHGLPGRCLSFPRPRFGARV